MPEENPAELPETPTPSAPKVAAAGKTAKRPAEVALEKKVSALEDSFGSLQETVNGLLDFLGKEQPKTPPKGKAPAAAAPQDSDDLDSWLCS
jgi:hypothetical protein